MEAWPAEPSIFHGQKGFQHGKDKSFVSTTCASLFQSRPFNRVTQAQLLTSRYGTHIPSKLTTPLWVLPNILEER